MKEYLFNDAETFNHSITTNSLRAAIAECRSLFGIHGRIRLTAHYSNIKGYKLDNTDYRFSITEI